MRTNVSPTQLKIVIKLIRAGLKWRDIEKIIGIRWEYLRAALFRAHPNFDTGMKRGRPFVKKSEFASDEEKKQCIDDYLYRNIGIRRLSKKYGFGEKRMEALLYREGVLKGTGRKYWNAQGTILREKLNLKVTPSARKTREIVDARRKESRKPRTTGPLEF